MKLKFTLLFVLYAFFRIGAYSQSNSVKDLDTLIILHVGGQNSSWVDLNIGASSPESLIVVDFGDGTTAEYTGTMHAFVNIPFTIKVAGTDISSLELGSVSNKELKSFVDVSNCPTLQTLACENLYLENLDVSKNPNLKYLRCNNNKIESFNLRNNLMLEELECYYNNLSALDVSRNPNLLVLNCHNNSLDSLDISSNPRLESLWCWENRLTALDITNNPNLFDLDCRNNKLPISELLKGLALDVFNYSPQYAVFNQATYSNNVTIDYSAQADGGNTIFYFRNRSKPGTDGSEVVAVNRTGMYTTQGSGVYFCEMGNPKLNQQKFYSHTANTIVNLPGNSSLKSINAGQPAIEENAPLFNIYPNPVTDAIHVTLTKSNLPATISIYYTDGRQLKKIEATEVLNSIDVQGLEPGTYIVKIDAANEQISRKIVKL